MEVEETTINEQQASLPRELNLDVFKYARINQLLLSKMFEPINKSDKCMTQKRQSMQNI